MAGRRQPSEGDELLQALWAAAAASVHRRWQNPEFHGWSRVGWPFELAVVFSSLFVVAVLPSLPPEGLTVPLTLLWLVGAVTLIVRHRRDIRAQRQRALQWQRRQEAQQAALLAARAREISTYDRMSWSEFERALAWLCRRDGCPSAQVTGKAGDLGADIVAVTPQGFKLVIQAKHYISTKHVGGPDMQRFAGTFQAVHQADIGVFVTTARFTKAARDLALHVGIRLFDRDALAAWASQTGPPPWDTPPVPASQRT